MAPSSLSARSSRSSRQPRRVQRRRGHEQHHRLAAGGRTGRQLGADRESGERPVPEGSPRRDRQRPVPDLGNHLQKLDATLAGGNAPDVIEMGNTEMTKYMAAGAFQDLSPTRRRSRTRARGSRASPPPAATAASCTASPTTPARGSSPTAPTCSRRPASRFRRASRSSRRRRRSWRAGNDEGLLARLHRGYRLVLRDELRLRLRRLHRDAGERQVEGHPVSPRSIAGLTAYKNFFNAASRRARPPTRPIPTRMTCTLRARPARWSGPGWFSCCVGDANKSLTRQFVMPSHTAGKPMPGFLGGSDLAVPVGGTRRLPSTGSRTTRARRR